MNREEFAKIMAYITAATGKSLSRESVEVYYDLLGDLSVEVLQIAAKRVCLAHIWATFPLPAEIRQAASETARGVVTDLSSAEAWAIAWRAAGEMDLDIKNEYVVNGVSYPSKQAFAMRDVPPLVKEAMQAFGITTLVACMDPVSVMRGQFMKTYEQLAAREKAKALLPAAVAKSVQEIGRRVPERITGIAGMIGVEPST